MPRAKHPVETIEVFRAAVTAARGQTARSSLYRWLLANHDEFLKDWQRGADWPAFIQGFTALGLTGRTGKAPSPETARKIWLQVRRDAAKAQAGQLGNIAPVLARGEIAPGVRALNMRPPERLDAFPFEEEILSLPLKLDIQPARPLAETASTKIAPAPAQAQIPVSQAPESQSGPRPLTSPASKPALTEEEIEARMRDLRNKMNAHSVPIPKPI